MSENTYMKLIGKSRRKELWLAGETISPDEVKPGMVVVNEHGGIKQVSHIEERSYSSSRKTDCTVSERRVHFNDGSSFRGPERVARKLHDITELAYAEIGAK